jgi:hypothetical protein
VGEAPARLAGGQGGVADRPLLGAGPDAGLDRAGVVAGELRQRDGADRVALRLERGRHLEVQPGAGLGTEPLVDRLAEQVVGEPVGAEGLGRPGQDTGPDGLVEQVPDGGRRAAADPREQGGRELRADHGGHAH